MGVTYQLMTRFTLLGVGAMNSLRYSPAGLLISRGQVRVAIDGGPGAERGRARADAGGR
jgi:hypothetical protein